MSKPDFRMVTVHHSQKISPNYQRLWLTGNSLADFPAESEGGYIKLLFGPDGQPVTTAEKLQSLEQRPTLRTYTVRYFEVAKQTLVVDMVRHGHDSGPASNWAQHVKLGDSILIGGPGPAKHLNDAADWFLLAADMTALPALSANLEVLPDDAQGIAVIEISDEGDKLLMTKPDGIEVQWLLNTQPDQPNTVLADAVKAIDWRAGQVAAWAACEFSNMRLIRQYFKKERQVPKEFLYVSSYWKIGSTEEQHKVVKRQDATEDEGSGK